MAQYTFRVYREQYLDLVVEAGDREEAWKLAANGSGTEHPDAPKDTIIDCTTPRRGPRVRKVKEAA